MNSLLERCREMLKSEASVEDVLGVMRREGLLQIASIRVLAELTGMTLREAKTAVHTSSVWADVREDTDSFHEQLERAAEQSRKSETD